MGGAVKGFSQVLVRREEEKGLKNQLPTNIGLHHRTLEYILVRQHILGAFLCHAMPATKCLICISSMWSDKLAKSQNWPKREGGSYNWRRWFNIYRTTFFEQYWSWMEDWARVWKWLDLDSKNDWVQGTR